MPLTEGAIAGCVVSYPFMSVPSRDTSSRGCCGYTVDSDLPLGFLRDCRANDLKVALWDEQVDPPPTDPLLEWKRDGGFFARIYETPGGFQLWIESLGWFDVRPGEAIIRVPDSPHDVLRETRLWGLPLALCALHRGDLALHSAAAEVNGRCVLLLAPSHHGKTTLAAAFFRAGHRLLSEDLTYCRLGPEPVAFPGPALLRIRKDIFEALDFPGTETVWTDEQRMYLALDEDRRGDGNPVPLAAVVFLRPSDQGVRLERVSSPEALRDLWPMAFNLPTDQGRKRCFEGVAALTESVPVFNLYRPMTLEALDEVIEKVERFSIA